MQTKDDLIGALYRWIDNEDTGHALAQRVGLTFDEERELRRNRLDALLEIFNNRVGADQ